MSNEHGVMNASSRVPSADMYSRRSLSTQEQRSLVHWSLLRQDTAIDTPARRIYSFVTGIAGEQEVRRLQTRYSLALFENWAPWCSSILLVSSSMYCTAIGPVRMTNCPLLYPESPSRAVDREHRKSLTLPKFSLLRGLF